MFETYQQWLDGPRQLTLSKPSYVNIYIGMWAAARGMDVDDYNAKLSRLLPMVDRLAMTVPVVWTMQPACAHGKAYKVDNINDKLLVVNNITASRL